MPHEEEYIEEYNEARGKQRFLDSLSDYDDIALAYLHKLIELKQTELMNSGVTDVDQSFGMSESPFEYSPIPQGDRDLSLPAGQTVIDFETGKVTHEDAGVLDATVRDFDQMVANVDDARVQTLRSYFVNCDTTCEIETTGDGGRFTLEAGQNIQAKSQGFKRLTLNLDLPGIVTGIASTRADAFNLGRVRAFFERKGSLDDGTYDDYTDIPVYPTNMTDTLPAGASISDYDEEIISIEHTPQFSVIAENVSSAANDMDIRLVAADTERVNELTDDDFYDIGIEQTDISKSEHVVFDVSQEHKYLKVQLRNSTNGEDVATDITVKGGS